MTWIKWLLKLYPRAWRQRYEAEFTALLEARGPRPGDALDILLGAWDARHMIRKQTLVETGMKSTMTAPGRFRFRDARFMFLIAGALSLLSLILLISALWGGMPERESEGTLFVTVVNLLGASAALHLAIRASARRLSNRLLRWSALYILVIIVAGALASRSPNDAAAELLPGLLISVGFGVWIALSAWGIIETRLLPIWLGAVGIVAGAGWALLMLLTAYHNLIQPVSNVPALLLLNNLVVYAFILSGVVWMGGLIFIGARNLLGLPRMARQAG